MKRQQVTGTNGDLGPEDEEERLRIGATLKALRQARGATPDQVANYAGMSRPLLANVEAGRKKLTNVLLARAAEILAVPQIAIMRPRPDQTVYPDIDYKDPTHRRRITYSTEYQAA